MPAQDLSDLLARKIIGQPNAIDAIAPYVQMFHAGLHPEGRPVGIFLLLGPTGTGKTKTVEALADVLHGSEKNVLKIDCGEFQMEHEVAKLIGAPPGYLGHRETTPMLNQQKLNGVATEQCGVSIVLFDEIEKAAPSLTRLLLGVLDKATLRLGDNTTVNFEKTLIFLTSNLGASEMMKEINPDFGFAAGVERERPDVTRKLQSIGVAAVRKRFSPEFVNRIDAVITYQPLTSETLAAILDNQLAQVQKHIDSRLAAKSFTLAVSEAAKSFLLELGTSSQYGARELNRTIHRQLMQPLAARVAAGDFFAGASIAVDLAAEGGELTFSQSAAIAAPKAAPPKVLVVDDNPDLLQFFGTLLEDNGLRLLKADTAEAAQRVAASEKPDAVLIDYFLPDSTGVRLALKLRGADPSLPVIVMTALDLSNDDQAVCEDNDFLLLRKPFLASEVIHQIENRIR